MNPSDSTIILATMAVLFTPFALALTALRVAALVRSYRRDKVAKRAAEAIARRQVGLMASRPGWLRETVIR